MRKHQLQKELDQANSRIAELEAKVWLYEGVLSANGFKNIIKDKEKKPEFGFVGKARK